MIGNRHFEVGMVIPAWSPRQSLGAGGTALVVAVAESRRAAWLVDAKNPFSPFGPKRHEIEWDERFGEKIVAHPDFLHHAFRVFRADKATGRREVPSEIAAKVAE